MKMITKKEYNYISNVVDEILDLFNNGQNVQMVIDCDEASIMMQQFLSKSDIKSFDINYELKTMGSYCGEYYIALCHLEENTLFVEKCYNADKRIHLEENEIGVTYISTCIKNKLYEEIINVDKIKNVILFDTENY